MRHASANLLWFEIQFLLFHSMDGSLTPKKTRCNVVCRLHSNVLFIFVCLNRKIIDQPNMICSPPSKHQLTNWKNPPPPFILSLVWKIIHGTNLFIQPLYQVSLLIIINIMVVNHTLSLWKQSLFPHSHSHSHSHYILFTFKNIIGILTRTNESDSC